jgi:hypothetical protein
VICGLKTGGSLFCFFPSAETLRRICSAYSGSLFTPNVYCNTLDKFSEAWACTVFDFALSILKVRDAVFVFLFLQFFFNVLQYVFCFYILKRLKKKKGTKEKCPKPLSGKVYIISGRKCFNTWTLSLYNWNARSCINFGVNPREFDACL